MPILNDFGRFPVRNFARVVRGTEVGSCASWTLSLSVSGQKCRDASLQPRELTENTLHISDVLAEYPNSVQGVGIGNNAPSRQQSVAGLVANDVRVRSRKPYRASSVGT
jgi:hypothetical protein